MLSDLGVERRSRVGIGSVCEVYPTEHRWSTYFVFGSVLVATASMSGAGIREH
jgi:hypothetical protein